MAEFLDSNVARLVILLTVVGMLSAVGWYIVSKFRGGAGQEQPTASEMLTNLQEMRQQGDVTEEEFRTIKRQLSARLKAELNGNKQQG
ncbi:MAG: SHOCT domain-containing protein [Planctomycetes bacterium]|nr:SHOCT domain-containing protein [Planctomycetota bacterium]